MLRAPKLTSVHHIKGDSKHIFISIYLDEKRIEAMKMLTHNDY